MAYSGQRPPKAGQKRYHGMIRNDMRSALNHLTYLQLWDAHYLRKGIDFNGVYYPTQLWDQVTRNLVSSMVTDLRTLLRMLGPIPTFQPPPLAADVVAQLYPLYAATAIVPGPAADSSISVDASSGAPAFPPDATAGAPPSYLKAMTPRQRALLAPRP